MQVLKKGTELISKILKLLFMKYDAFVDLFKKNNETDHNNYHSRAS